MRYSSEQISHVANRTHYSIREDAFLDEYGDSCLKVNLSVYLAAAEKISKEGRSDKAIQF